MSGCTDLLAEVRVARLCAAHLIARPSTFLLCAAGKPLRVPVSDVFKNKAGALLVAGKIEAGALKPGLRVMVVPGHEVATVRGIEVGGQVSALGCSPPGLLFCVHSQCEDDKFCPVFELL